MVRFRLFVFIFMVVVSAAVLLWSGILPAGARDVQGFVVSPDNSSVERKYDPIPGSYNAPVVPFAAIRPTACRSAAYCDTIALNAKIPAAYKGVHTIVVTLTWTPPPPFPPGDRLVLYAWDNDDAKEIFGPLANDSAGSTMPRQLKLGDLAGLYYLTVVNVSGVNLGYQMKVEWIPGLLPDLDYLVRTEKEGGGSTGFPTTKTRSGIRDGFDVVDEEAAKDLAGETIKVPGPDGKLMDVTLPTLERGSREASQGGINPVVLATVALLLLGGVLFAFFRWREYLTSRLRNLVPSTR